MTTTPLYRLQAPHTVHTSPDGDTVELRGIPVPPAASAWAERELCWDVAAWVVGLVAVCLAAVWVCGGGK